MRGDKCAVAGGDERGCSGRILPLDLSQAESTKLGIMISCTASLPSNTGNWYWNCDITPSSLSERVRRTLRVDDMHPSNATLRPHNSFVHEAKLASVTEQKNRHSAHYPVASGTAPVMEKNDFIVGTSKCFHYHCLIHRI
jgi:hypothetical protein